MHLNTDITHRWTLDGVLEVQKNFKLEKKKKS